MLLPILIILIILISAAALYMRFREVRLAYIWLLLLVPGILIWLILLLSRPNSIAQLNISNYFRFGEDAINLQFAITEQNKPLSFGVITMMLSYLLKTSINPRGDQSLSQWIESIVCGFICWLIILAENTWTVLLAWTLLDIFQLIMYFRIKQKNTDKFIIHHLVKYAGSMLLVYIAARTYQAGSLSFFGKSVANLGLFMFAASFLHSGLLFQLPDEEVHRHDEDRSLILEFVPLSANLFIMMHVNDLGITPITKFFLQVALACVSIFFAFKWVNGNHERQNIQALKLSVAGICGVLFNSNNRIGILYMLIVFLLFMNWIFLYTKRHPALSLFWILAIIISTCLPFTLGTQIFSVFLSNENYLEVLAAIIPMSILITGIWKFSSTPKGSFANLEQMVQGVYVIGLALPLIASILIIILMTPGILFTMNGLVLGAIQVMLISGLILFYKKNRKLEWMGFAQSHKFTNFRRFISLTLQTVFSSVGIGFDYFENLFEGDGGILWSIVLLSLLITILAAQGGVV